MATQPKPKTQEQSVLNQINRLNQMSTRDLHQKWNDLFGTDAGQHGRQYMIRRLAYRLQELIYGGLSRKARAQFQELTEDTKAKKHKSQVTNLQAGTRLLREWHGQNYEVIVQDNGFLFNGKTYRSLSAIARAITGRHCGGRRFFGLKPSKTSGKSK
jgi:hypothetical protein